MTIRERIEEAIEIQQEDVWAGGVVPPEALADAILAAIPEIAALDKAKEGWLTPDGISWHVFPFNMDALKGCEGRERTEVLIIPKPSTEAA